MASLPSPEVHRDCTEGIERVGHLLETLGHQVELSHPQAFGEFDWLGDYATRIAVSTAASLDEWARRIGNTWSETDLEPPTRKVAEQGRATSGKGLLLRLAAPLEEAVPWHHRRPEALEG